LADTSIRPLCAGDGDAVRAIERAAGERFREVGLAFVAEHEPATLEELAAYASAERGWVATTADDDAIGYVLVDVVDGNAHIEQVSVHPAHQGRGVGGALVDHVHAWAVHTARPAITLTTFRDVEWNRPLYEHLGFVVMTGDEVGPELAAVCRTEATHGLTPELRVCMRRLVD
jgi:GNAT superfamily N-acetyltransferase